jgi:hypothetical protein
MHSDVYHIQNVWQWRVSLRTMKWSNITPKGKFSGPTILIEQVKKNNRTDKWSSYPIISTSISLPPPPQHHEQDPIWSNMASLAHYWKQLANIIPEGLTKYSLRNTQNDVTTRWHHITGKYISNTIQGNSKIWAQGHWVSGFFPSSSILKTMKHNISEIGSVSVLRVKDSDTYSAGSFRKSKLLPVGNPHYINYSYVNTWD